MILLKLSPALIHKHLSRLYPAELSGSRTEDMVLEEPAFCTDAEPRLLSGTAYVARAEHLPPRAFAETGALLICIGRSRRLNHYQAVCNVIVIDQPVDHYVLYRCLQEIFSLYRRWEGQMLQLLLTPSTPQDLLDCSLPVWNCPIFVLDAAYKYVAFVSPDGMDSTLPEGSGSLPAEDFMAYLDDANLNTTRRGSFVLRLSSITALCVNLFTAADKYNGCMYFILPEAELVPGAGLLAERMAVILTRMEEITPAFHSSEESSLREVLNLLLDEVPLSPERRLFLKARNNRKTYVCLAARYKQAAGTLPVQYLLATFDRFLPGCVLLPRETGIFCLVSPDVLEAALGRTGKGSDTLFSLIRQLEISVGVSNSFSDLYMLQTYYGQAESAIENGAVYHPGEYVHFFSEYALSEMIINAMGSFPVESYFPAGFEELLRHDKNGGTSYLETLDVFLQENMSYAAAARRLFIHRSSLIERINRIQRDLSLNLEDPDQRLQLQMILKYLSIEEQLKK